MPTASPSLDDLRRRIDQLDDALQDVLIQRAEIVAEVARLKKADGTSPVRPGREARILRRLVARHRGPFPRPMLVRLWRELLSGTIAMQTAMSVAVFAPDNRTGLWDLARDHYGSHTPMTSFRSTGDVIAAVGSGRATLGVLPLPEQDESELWWRALMHGDVPKPRVIARLPFGGRGNARPEGGDALVIGKMEPEPSGADRSLYIIGTDAELSRARLAATFSAAGLAANLLAGTRSGTAAQLVEFDDWIAPEDARLKDALAALAGRITQVTPLGFYAQPLTRADLAGEEPAR